MPRNDEQWLAHRIAHGIPKPVTISPMAAAFPHDIAMDQLNGIGFKKGCYVGQEVVSRMQHRGTARKRPMMIVGAIRICRKHLQKYRLKAQRLGMLGSVSGPMGLAEIRLDRAAKALADGKTFDVDGIAVTLQKPAWAGYGDEFDEVK